MSAPLPFLSRYRTLRCAAPGCDATTEVQRKHGDNLTAAGGWWCHKQKRSA